MARHILAWSAQEVNKNTVRICRLLASRRVERVPLSGCGFGDWAYNARKQVRVGHVLTVDMEPKKSSEWRAWLREVLSTLLITMLIFLGINLVSGRFRVDGQSMVPTLVDGELILASKAAYWFQEPARGDIVVLRPPQDEGGTPYIKRIIGLPGERVTIREGRVYINGVVLNEPYVSGPTAYSGEWVVTPGTYFVLGDNRNHSSDSHAWGLLPRRNIIAKAVLGYWPLSRLALLTYDRYPELMARDHKP